MRMFCVGYKIQLATISKQWLCKSPTKVPAKQDNNNNGQQVNNDST
jgi:hypothetical protein